MTFPVLSANGPTGYNLTRSLRFRNSASAYLNRTPATTTNQKTWTWSGWVKLGSLSSTPVLLCQYTDGVNQTQIQWRSGGGGGNDYQIRFYDLTASAFTSNVYWSPLFRDPSSWYHIVFVADTTQATDTNRLKLYVNGVQVTSTTSATWPAQNTNLRINLAAPHFINANGAGGTYEGYLAEVNFIDGQALTPSSFGSTNATTGVWQPARYTGTYGTNGFYLPFTDITSTTTLGYDSSGNGNNWTPNNISLTAGATYDSMTDVPTLTSATAANYAVMNSIGSVGNGTYSSANLDFTSNSAGGAWQSGLSTIGVSSGKWYCEITATAITGANLVFVGAASNTFTGYANYLGASSDGWGVQYGNGGTPSIYKYNGSGTLITAGTIVAGDILQVAIDVDNGRIWFGKNNTWAEGSPSAGTGASFTNLTGTIFFGASSLSTGNKLSANFGQRPFSYTPPSGFVALNTYNLPASTVPNGAAYMAATLYTGTSGNVSVVDTVNGVGFQPDFLWVKARSNAQGHNQVDSVRGATSLLQSNSIAAEQTLTNPPTFNSNGFTSTTDIHTNGYTYVAWQWKAGGTAVSNTNGSITSSVSANTTSGFSVVTYTGTGANATVGHGLGVAPSMMIFKVRSTTNDWAVYHSALATPATQALFLNLTNAVATTTTAWNSTAPTSSVFSIGNSSPVNVNATTFVAYCFAAIKGFSAFGSYTGNGSTDGPFVYLGFRPRFVMMKASSSTSNWTVIDTARDAYNYTQYGLYPNLSNAESNPGVMDMLSNGLKIRSTFTDVNGSGTTYIYAAFAESPFQNSLAR